MLCLWGWGPRFRSGLIGRTCSRNLLEWLLRQRLATCSSLQFLEASKVQDLLTNANNSIVTGVRLRCRDEALPASQPKFRELAADLVVDATGRNSSI